MCYASAPRTASEEEGQDMTLFTDEQLSAAEGYLANDQIAEISPVLEGMVSDMEAYIDESCVTTGEVQYFSFASAFEKLTYRRVESDPRELRDAPAPFDRAYADYAFALIREHDLEKAAEELKQSVRWNPMECAHRLDLAAVEARLGNAEESLKLSYSVFSRASRPSHLAHAYLNFCDYFSETGQNETAAACAKCALRMAPEDKRANNAATKLAAEAQCDPRAQTDELTESLLAAQGIPDGANVEVVLSALLLADISAANGDMDTCRDMVQTAVGLVGQKKARALAQIVREQGEERIPEDGGEARASESADPVKETLDAAAAAAKEGKGAADGSGE